MELDIAAFNDALGKNAVIILSCSCEIHYSGRAESFLGSGGRIIVIKADKTLLIHQPAGSNPINYMKEGTSYSLSRNEGKLVLRCSNIPLKEYMDIFISKVHSFQQLQMEDSAKIQLVGSERDMSDMIYGNPALIEPGFKPLSREEHTKYGFIDVFGYDKNNVLVVIECKRYTADLKAVDQLQRYVKKIKELKGLVKVRGIIAAPEISPNTLQMLKDNGFEYRKISPPKYLERFNKGQKSLGDYES
ncbi:endonuclease NucS [Candidatus Woesearchaeota archaeon]|nr:endonuclease NucS [Candidatus Woesearchaeota archaeon]